MARRGSLSSEFKLGADVSGPRQGQRAPNHDAPIQGTILLLFRNLGKDAIKHFR